MVLPPNLRGLTSLLQASDYDFHILDSALRNRWGYTVFPHAFDVENNRFANQPRLLHYVIEISIFRPKTEAKEGHREAREGKRRAERAPVDVGRAFGRSAARERRRRRNARPCQVITGVLVPRGVRAGMDAGRARAAEGNGRRPIVCTRNRTLPISGCAKNGDAPVSQAWKA